MKVQLDFVSSESLSSKGSMEKVSFILERIKKNVIVVLEEGLNPMEETELIEATMREINTKNFHGIEFYRLDHQAMNIRNKIANYIAGKRLGLTIVGPTRMVEAIKKEPDYISMLAKGGGKRRHISARGAGKSTKKARKRS
jgi:hypothetical protein